MGKTRTKEEHQGLMKFFTVLGGLVAIVVGVLVLAGWSWYWGGIWWFFGPIWWLRAIVLIAFGILCLYVVAKPNEPIPFDWIVLLVFAIVLIVFGTLIGGILVLIAAIIGILT